MASKLLPGDVVPWFHAPLVDGRIFHFSSAGGRPIVIVHPGRFASAEGQLFLAAIARHADFFDDVRASLFGLCHPDDAAAALQRIPGIRWYVDEGGVTATELTLDEPQWLVVDRMLRVGARGGVGDIDGMMAAVNVLAARGEEVPAPPVLVVPRVLGAGLVRRLIAAFDAAGGTDSGVMVERDGVTVGVLDHKFKRRRDWPIEDDDLRRSVSAHLQRFLLPMVERVFQFKTTRIERWMVARYDDADGGGHFAPHRDNTTAGTAHRRFACTINLNAGDYEGGDLVFPEFSMKPYRAPTGGAVVFSCSLLHQVLPVTRGQRYALLPFFYDEAAAQLREANSDRVAPELAGYRAAR